MKFLTKINRNYLLLLGLVLLIVSTSGYFLLRYILLEETKESLLGKAYLIKNQIEETNGIPNIFPIIEVKEISYLTNEKPAFKEIFILNELEDELEPYIEYSTQIEINNVGYSVKIRESAFEREDLIIILALTLFILIFAVLAIFYFISKRINKTIWADFENNLHEIERFGFSENKGLHLVNTNIEEFDRLNKVVNNLTKKLQSDYILLKEFTENASHEIQTPLSIVLLNLEEVLQQDLTKDAFQKIVASINAIKRLSALNQSLIILTKIENKQFGTDKTLVINDILSRKVQEFSSIFEIKKLKVEISMEQSFSLEMNEHLAEIMINNLLSNAVNHNFEGGNIKITVRDNEFQICNTGNDNSLSNETIFNRFSKGNSKTFGLGLAIVKNICDTSNLGIKYIKKDLHCFRIKQELKNN